MVSGRGVASRAGGIPMSNQLELEQQRRAMLLLDNEARFVKEYLEHRLRLCGAKAFTQEEQKLLQLTKEFLADSGCEIAGCNRPNKSQ